MSSEPPRTVDAEATELAGAHLARWLDDLLPPGPCLVWAGGVTLASALATDGRRAVLLVEPRPAALEAAARTPRAGVTLAEAPADGLRFVSAVVIADPDAPEAGLDPLLRGPLEDAAVAVVTDPTGARAVSACLVAGGRTATTVDQHVRLASTIGTDDRPQIARSLGAPADAPDAVVVLAGIDGRPSVLVGSDAGPSRRWGQVEWVRHSLRDVDVELRADDTTRIEALEEEVDHGARRAEELEVHIDGLQRRIDDLEGSTSWRLSAPLRWLSDRATRR